MLDLIPPSTSIMTGCTFTSEARVWDLFAPAHVTFLAHQMNLANRSDHEQRSLDKPDSFDRFVGVL